MIQAAWQAGATKCLTKANCSPKQLVEIVRSILNVPLTSIQGGAQDEPATSPTGALALSSHPSDAKYQLELRQTYLKGLPPILAALRLLWQSVVKSKAEGARLLQLFELYRAVHSLTGSAGIMDFSQVTELSSALEALLKELYERPKHINQSSLRTVASAVDVLASSFEHAIDGRERTLSDVVVLIVDDAVISRRAIRSALQGANLKSISVEAADQAITLLNDNQFDLVFLDVEMPQINGFELCSKLRAIPAHRTTAVVFVTALTDFESRARSILSGGNDLIAKPFLLVELAVKALTYLLMRK